LFDPVDELVRIESVEIGGNFKQTGRKGPFLDIPKFHHCTIGTMHAHSKPEP